MQEFERSKEEIGGKSVLITSWFDESSGSWRASAPSYAYLCGPNDPGEQCSSRQSAIARLIGELGTRITSGRP